MSKEGDRQSVFRTTKVRTALKTDNSWIQRHAEGQAEEEEKPWLAEVRGTRTNSVFAEPNPVSPSTSPDPVLAATSPPPTSTSPTTASTGYLIRGVFTKTDTKKPISQSYNGSSTFTPKKPSDSYKKIAPHSVRTASESFLSAETILSPEEQDKRAEAASSILRTSAVKQRSYVLSAAKKYESPEKADIVSPNSVSFIAKRVEVNDEEESAPSDTQNDVTPHVPTPQDAVPLATEQSSCKEVAPASVSDTKASPAKVSQVVKAEPAPLPSNDSGKDDLTLTESLQVEAEAAPAPSDDGENDDLLAPAERTIELPPETVKSTSTMSVSELISVLERSGSPKAPEDSSVDLLDPCPVDTTLSPQERLIPLSSQEMIQSWETSSLVEAKPALVPSDDLENYDLVALAESTEVLVDPVPSTTDVEYSHDLLSGPDSHQSEKTVDSLDRLAVDFIPIDTNRKYTDSPFGDTLGSPTDDLPADTQSVTEQNTKFEDLISTQTNISVSELITVLEDSESPKAPKDSADNDSGSKTETLGTSEEEREEPGALGADNTMDDRNEPEPQRPSSVSLDRALENTVEELDSLESKKSFVYVKEYVDSELANTASQNGGSPPSNSRNCTYCSELVGSDAKITIEDLNIYCHPSCFKCGVCGRPMGDLLYNMFLHRSVVHCETCYSNIF